jgi:hypothetical protein
METVDSSVVSEIKTGRTGRRDSIISLLSDLNEDGNKDSEVDDFVPSNRFNFRFSEAELLQIKRGDKQGFFLEKHTYPSKVYCCLTCFDDNYSSLFTSLSFSLFSI